MSLREGYVEPIPLAVTCVLRPLPTAPSLPRVRTHQCFGCVQFLLFPCWLLLVTAVVQPCWLFNSRCCFPLPPLPPPPPPPRVCPIIHPDVPLSHAGTSECSTSNCQPPQLPRLLSVALPPDGQHGGGHGHHQHVPPPVHHQPAHARAAYRCRLAAGQRLHQGRAVQVDPMKPMLKAPGHML